MPKRSRVTGAMVASAALAIVVGVLGLVGPAVAAGPTIENVTVTVTREDALAAYEESGEVFQDCGVFVVLAAFTAEVTSPGAGVVARIDNRRLAKVAKLAGAPNSAEAGLSCALRLGDRVERGQPLFTVHAQSRGELDYAIAYARANTDILLLQGTTP